MATDPYADAGARARQFFGSKAFQDAVSTVRSSAHHDLNTMLPMTLGAPDVMKSAAPAMTRFLEGLFGTTPQGGQAAPARAAVQAVAKAAPAQQQQAAQGPAGAPSAAPTFNDLLQAYGQANHGGISLRALDALAGVANKGAASAAAGRRLPSITDVAGAQALDLGNQLFQAQVQQAQASGDKNAYMQAIQDHQDRLERLARARAIDPTNPYYGGQ
jgi:hypothetical protein